MRSDDTKCPPILKAVNHLVCQEDVWRHETEAYELEYSDGLQEEAGLRKALDEVNDLSWDSPELGPPYDSWAQEYHLSPLRANLLRGLNLSNSAQVLEIGAGCGAITRYLGDMGLRVDAVEGSSARAALARKRCTDLDQVSIINADFHQLNLPDHQYDLALFIGVLEYAQRFAPADLSAREAVVQMLSKAIRALSPGGQLIIAIENRLGAKYLSGWAEDHLGTSWSGIAGYPVTAGSQDGIRTFDRTEWESLFNELDVKYRFFFPLPDYKLPKAVISDSGVEAPGVNVIWGRHVSVNRTTVIPSSAPARFQQNALYRSGLLPSCADSFGIVLSVTEEPLGGMMAHDWIVFEEPAIGIPRGICVAQGASTATLFPDGPSADKGFTLPQGESLFQYWLRYAVAGRDRRSFSRLLFEHLSSTIGIGNLPSASALLVDDAGEILAEPFPWPDAKDTESSRDAQGWAESVLDQFFHFAQTDLESLPRMEVWAHRDGIKQEVLSQLKGAPERQSDFSGRVTFPAIYWACEAEDFSEERKCVVSCPIEGRQTLVFFLPEPADSNVLLRFDPSDHEPKGAGQVVIVESIHAYTGTNTSGIDLMPALTGCETGKTHQLGIVAQANGALLEIKGNDPWVVIELSSVGLPRDVVLERVEVSLKWSANNPMPEPV